METGMKAQSQDAKMILGCEMFDLAKDLYPITRSITGNGVRQTHDILRTILPGLITHEIESGVRCFDWTIPDEWNIKSAYIEKMDGRRVVDFADCNLHVVMYSEPIDRIVTRAELEEHLHSRPDMPNAIPYITSYYRRSWGFCVSETQRRSLTDDQYRVVIDSTLEPGSLSYADVVFPGRTDEEVLISTYTCHPSMGNNEVSGMVVAAFLGRWLAALSDRRYTYRLVFVPETIGAIAYISRHIQEMKAKTVAGFVITCVGDDGDYSYMPSRQGNTLADRAAVHALNHVVKKDFKAYSYLERGSDERQYCAPGINLPVCSIMRTKYGVFPQYHTSLDNLGFISAEGLYGGFAANRACLESIEVNEVYHTTTVGEPWLYPRNLRPPLTFGVGLPKWSRDISNILAYADGTVDLIGIADLLGESVLDIAEVAKLLKEAKLLRSIG